MPSVSLLLCVITLGKVLRVTELSGWWEHISNKIDHKHYPCIINTVPYLTVIHQIGKFSPTSLPFNHFVRNPSGPIKCLLLATDLLLMCFDLNSAETFSPQSLPCVLFPSPFLCLCFALVIQLSICHRSVSHKLMCANHWICLCLFVLASVT